MEKYGEKGKDASTQNIGDKRGAEEFVLVWAKKTYEKKVGWWIKWKSKAAEQWQKARPVRGEKRKREKKGHLEEGGRVKRLTVWKRVKKRVQLSRNKHRNKISRGQQSERERKSLAAAASAFEWEFQRTHVCQRLCVRSCVRVDGRYEDSYALDPSCYPSSVLPLQCGLLDIPL